MSTVCIYVKCRYLQQNIFRKFRTYIMNVDILKSFRHVIYDSKKCKLKYILILLTFLSTTILIQFLSQLIKKNKVGILITIKNQI